MKLLLDENLSPRLVQRLARDYPESRHVEDFGLRGRPDREIWDHAARQGFILASKDTDFHQLSFLHGHPPKVVWLDVGNAGTAAIADLFSSSVSRMRVFESNEQESLLVLELPQA